MNDLFDSVSQFFQLARLCLTVQTDAQPPNRFAGRLYFVLFYFSLFYLILGCPVLRVGRLTVEPGEVLGDP